MVSRSPGDGPRAGDKRQAQGDRRLALRGGAPDHIDLGEDHECSVVSEPDRRHLWILSRTPALPEDLYQGIVERLKARGFDMSRVVRAPQPGG